MLENEKWNTVRLVSSVICLKGLFQIREMSSLYFPLKGRILQSIYLNPGRL